ncbi:MAG: hypothetical protein IJU84_07855 [Clostridia bacterium]|nr:hypothetical protein [Clostridia bacterium]
MLIKRSIVLARGGAGGKRELAAAEIARNGRAITVGIKKNGVVGITDGKAAVFSPLKDGKAEFIFDGDPLGIGVFENGALAFYGETGRGASFKRALIDRYSKFTNEKDAEYDDYAIAETDYFKENNAIMRDIGHILKNKEVGDNDWARVFKAGENASAKAADRKTATGEKVIYNENKGGAGANAGGEREGEGYYGEIKNVLSELFYKFPHEKDLEKAVTGGTFVKIIYSENKYYVVGETKENGKPEYVIFGVPSPEDKKQPKEFNGAAYFVPCGAPAGGYYLLYRDAFSGEVLSAKN